MSAGGETAAPLAVLRREDESLPPRARALARVASTLTAQPWALAGPDLADLGRLGLDQEQIEAAFGVVSMFNYFTRVADATGIEFDYQTPLPAFEPDTGQVTAPRPDRSVPSGPRPQPRYQPLRRAWASWRAYVLETDEPLSPPERRWLARAAAEESADWDGAEALGAPEPADHDLLTRFARKLSRQPWQMEAGDLEQLRASGYSEEAVLHMISVVAHQNADSRLAAGLRAAARYQ